MKINSNPHGFTLVELLIAIAISAALMLLAYQAFSGAINVEGRVKQATENLNDLQRTWRYMQDDLFHTVPRPWIDQFDTVQPAMTGLLSDRQTLDSTLAVSTDSHLLRFVRSGAHNFFDQPQSDLQHIVYRLSKSESEVPDKFTISVWRDYWRPIDSVSEPDIKSLKLLDDLQEIQFLYLSQSAQRVDDQSWLGGWPESDEQGDQLPIAVEVAITTDALGETKRIFLLSDGNE